ncbi:acyltransferase [Henriciella mobilis]|uniref:Acyltransferase n=1 Tax=Henriciella mobilis TaxID=2305467 RepID=A0A399RAR8_9PROT|nr:acyltransferase [Henriciella mobilis]
MGAVCADGVQACDSLRQRARPAASKSVFAPVWRQVCRLVLALGGWKVRGDWPDAPKAVMIAAPHTSNWDGFWMLAAAGLYQIKLKWMGKKSLTDHALGGFVRWLGCVPVDRTSASDVVDQMAAAFAGADRMILAIAPEGTRARAGEWKSGYYRIAMAAGVPLIVSVLDYGSRTIRIDGIIQPTGDYEADLPRIQAHYAGAEGRHAGRFSVGEAPEEEPSGGEIPPEDKG